MPTVEKDFIDNLFKELKTKFRFKRFEILDGRGTIVKGSRK